MRSTYQPMKRPFRMPVSFVHCTSLVCACVISSCVVSQELSVDRLFVFFVLRREGGDEPVCLLCHFFSSSFFNFSLLTSSFHRTEGGEGRRGGWGEAVGGDGEREGRGEVGVREGGGGRGTYLLLFNPPLVTALS